MSALETAFIPYQIQGATFEGYLAYKGSSKEKRPGVLLCHAWAGRDDFILERAREYAEKGYAAFALDLYGKGKVGRTPDENKALMNPLMADRPLLLKRLQESLGVFIKQPMVDAGNVSAIGFCFGGLCVLDLARSRAHLKAAVSVHGSLKLNPELSQGKIHSKILVLHGNDDPGVSQEQLDALKIELTRRHADWQLHIFGNTMHAFTNPKVNDPKSGLVYNPVAAKRSWLLIDNFLNEK